MTLTVTLLACFLSVAALPAFLLARILLLAHSNRRRRRSLISDVATPPPGLVVGSRAGGDDDGDLPATCRLLIILGSGGHTAEMLTLVSDLLEHSEQGVVSEVVYVVGATDGHSTDKAGSLHLQSERDGSSSSTSRPDTGEQDGDTNADRTRSRGAKVRVSFRRLPRAREVGQSFVSAVPSTLRAAFAALWIVATTRPHVVLANGPANSAVTALMALLVRATVAPQRCRVVYVESFARVRSLSLSGKIVYWFADRFVVQWEAVHKSWPLSEYYGRLC